MLAAGCAARGVAAFTPVEMADRPRVRHDLRAIAQLRRLIAAWRPDVVHAHGLRAGALAAVALAFVRPTVYDPRPALVVTVHNAPAAGGLTGAIYCVLELTVARRADSVLAVSADLEERMRAAGARRVGRALVPALVPAAGVSAETPPAPAWPGDPEPGRPVVLAVGRLAELKSQAARLGLDARFPGHRDDVPALLAAAAVFVLPSMWEGQPLILQEALRAGVPVVATRAGGTPELTGED